MGILFWILLMIYIVVLISCCLCYSCTLEFLRVTDRQYTFVSDIIEVFIKVIESTFSNLVWSIVNFRFDSPMFKFLVFSLFKDSPHFRHQLFSTSRYFCRINLVFFVLVTQVARSSANGERLQLGSMGMSETNKAKRIGERQDPWGTPAFILKGRELKKSKLTKQLLSVKKDFIIFNIYFGIFKVFSLYRR